MTPQLILRGARDLIADPARYDGTWEAHTAGGEMCCFDSDNAVAWDAVGAMWRVADVNPDHPKFLGGDMLAALAALWSAVVDTPPQVAWYGASLIDQLAAWQSRLAVAVRDVNPHATVLDALDRAAVIAERTEYERARRVEAEQLRARRYEKGAA